MERGTLSARRRPGLRARGRRPTLPCGAGPATRPLDLASDALLFLLMVVGTAIVGGLGPALVAGALGRCC